MSMAVAAASPSESVDHTSRVFFTSSGDTEHKIIADATVRPSGRLSDGDVTPRRPVTKTSATMVGRVLVFFSMMCSVVSSRRSSQKADVPMSPLLHFRRCL